MTGKGQPNTLGETLLHAMRAIDNQIAREMQRTPAELEEHGVQKWEPFQKRIEAISALILNGIGDGEIQIDSLLVMAQAMTKSLALLVDDLGPDGLGKVRSDYCSVAIDQIARDSYQAGQTLRTETELT